jgi:serine/threonine-protein kinase
VLGRLQAALGDTYRIERELGGGGMSHVFVAEEVALGRQVVVKVLPPEMGAGVNAERFRREIQLAASLQHPHIVPLLSAGHSDDLVWYTMPLIEGESLRTRLAREGELPVPEAVRLLRDVADALAYAHQHGVVHRDIKPDNVLISGQHAVVTDFGVSKAITAATGESSLTSIGVALGTPAYMSPEQAAAEPKVDHRADVYALGAMAYEMLTGAPPFSGDSQAVLAAHVTRAPEAVTARRAAVPAALGALVMRCLEKKAADRWQSASELHQQLEVMATPSGGMTPTGAVPATQGPVGSRQGMVRTFAWVAVGVAAVAVVWAGWRWLRPVEPVWELSNIRQVTHEPELEMFPALSPDGREVAYAAGYGGATHIYVRDVTGGRALPLTDDRAGAQSFPVWSPDGRRILFAQNGGGTPAGEFGLPRMGGVAAPVVVAGVYAMRGDSMLYQRGESLFIGGLDAKRESFVVTAHALHYAAWSPDGSRVAFVQNNPAFLADNTWGNAAPSQILTVGVRGGVSVLVTDTGGQPFYESPAWLPDGNHLLLVSNRDGPRDLYVLRVGANGRPQSGLQRVTTGLEPLTVSLSADGRSVAYERFTFHRNLYRLPIPRAGVASIRDAAAVTTGSQVVEGHDVSRDGRWLAFDSNLEGKSDIYVMPTNGGEPRRVTRGPGEDFAPKFSPDGREIVFYSTRYGSRDLFVINADGTGETRLTRDPADEYFPTFSPDGRRIAFFRVEGGRSWVYAMHRDSLGGAWSAPEQITRGGWENEPRWSPDGRKLVYFTARGIAAMTLGGAERLVADIWQGFSAGFCPLWSADGRAIWFGATLSSGQAGIFEVPETGGKPRMIVRFDDPARAVYPAHITVGAGSIYLAISEFQSDVYVAELKRR